VERDELRLRERIALLLEDYSLEDILETNDITVEDTLVFLYFEFGLKLPEVLDGNA
jgi:hypothetical protein